MFYKFIINQIKKGFWEWYKKHSLNTKSNQTVFFISFFDQKYKSRLKFKKPIKTMSDLNRFLITITLRRANIKGNLYNESIKKVLYSRKVIKYIIIYCFYWFIFFGIIFFMVYIRMYYFFIEHEELMQTQNVSMYDMVFYMVLIFSVYVFIFIYTALIFNFAWSSCKSKLINDIFGLYNVSWTLNSKIYIDMLNSDIIKVKTYLDALKKIANVYFFFKCIKIHDVFFTKEHEKYIAELKTMLQDLNNGLNAANMVLREIKQVEGIILAHANIILLDSDIIKKDAKWKRQNPRYYGKINYYFSYQLKDELHELEVLHMELYSIYYNNNRSWINIEKFLKKIDKYLNKIKRVCYVIKKLKLLLLLLFFILVIYFIFV